MKRLAFLSVIALFVAVEACSSSDNPVIPPPDGDAGQASDASTQPETSGPADADAPSDAGADAPVDANTGACNTLTDVGPQVSYVSSSDPAPVAAGGTILDGTYALTSIVAYTTSSVTFPAGTATISISGSTVQSVTHSAGNNAKQTQTGTFTTSGTDFTITTTCSTNKTDGGAGPRTTGYTATETTFALLLDGGAQGVLVTTYTKQ